MVSGLVTPWLTHGEFHSPQTDARPEHDALSQDVGAGTRDRDQSGPKSATTANIKLSSVASDVLGKSGRAMLDAVAQGQTDQVALAELARGSLRGKREDLRKALDGRVQPHHQLLLKHLLAHIDFLDEALVQLEKEIEPYVTPFEEAMTLVQSVPGVGETAAASIIAEIGIDMTRFPSDKHLASWAGLCPGNKLR